MNLAIAIWRINPAAEYTLSDDKTQIVDWRGPGPQPTPAELQAAWDAYQSEQAAAATAKQAADTERTAAIDDVRTTAAAALTRLDAIIANGGTFTAAQVRDAMVDLARIQRRELRLLRAQAG